MVFFFIQTFYELSKFNTYLRKQIPQNNLLLHDLWPTRPELFPQSC